MPIRDPHDPRDFRRWLSFNDDGSVASVHEVEASVNQPFPGAVEVTDVQAVDFASIKVSPEILNDVKAGRIPPVIRKIDGG